MGVLTATPEKEKIVKQERKVVKEVINIQLEKTEYLCATQRVQTLEISHVVLDERRPHFISKLRRVLNSEDQTIKYKLREVNIDELTKMRATKQPTFVYKLNEKLYYTKIPKKLMQSSGIFGKHVCSSSEYECRRLYALSDEEGGCGKVRDIVKFIEKYDWIKEGYQTFNTSHDLFIVLACNNYMS